MYLLIKTNLKFKRLKFGPLEIVASISNEQKFRLEKSKDVSHKNSNTVGVEK